MKKVVFSITNARSKSDKKLSGFGYLTEGNLLCPCVSKNNKPYIRVFDDVEKRCRPVPNKTGEFQGYVTMYFTIIVSRRSGNNTPPKFFNARNLVGLENARFYFTIYAFYEIR